MFYVFCYFLFVLLMPFFKIVSEENLQKSHFLSVIMPCYNRAAIVGESIESIYQQNLTTPFEVICTDDCSTDQTYEVLKKYAGKYSNFKVYKHEKNMGGGPARNTCISHSKGDIIFCLDSDNILEPNSLHYLINCLDESKCEAASFSHLVMFRGNREIVEIWRFIAPNNICDLKHIVSNSKTPAASGNYLYTKESYIKAGGYPTDKGAMDAWGFGFRQHATGIKIALLPNSFYWHRLSEDSYFRREWIKKTTDKNAYEILKEFIFLFDESTQKYFSSYNGEGFFEKVDRGYFKLNS